MSRWGKLAIPMQAHPTAANMSAVAQWTSAALNTKGYLSSARSNDCGCANLLFGGPAKAATKPLGFVPRLTNLFAETAKLGC